MAKKAQPARRGEALADGLLQLLGEALQEPKQLYRYLVTEKTVRGNETVERTFEKFDTKAAREMANLLKELMEIKGERAVGGSAAGVIVLPESGMEEEP